MSLNLKIECSGMHTGWQAKPGKYSFELEDCQVDSLTTEQQMELCSQMDFDVVAEYVDSMRRLSNVA
ncbi:hypothetical protein AI29_12070 [bacteria symbiont BFo2 of Frankliniella occidentalis]|nr:hypothetical protein AI29_12070 [bacteria symbiont BFo2 of Frankliniella occidentalis]KYP94481.1 hypothetical protein WB60_01155 [bacteria symbiont BFo2 of Frankliniella occidentalis]KYP95332.1 hypothetical protein WB67_06565 [bacteria symbiont BFo2 of Frankliniella occidentalis]